jgi:hypothetical protein
MLHVENDSLQWAVAKVVVRQNSRAWKVKLNAPLMCCAGVCEIMAEKPRAGRSI